MKETTLAAIAAETAHAIAKHGHSFTDAGHADRMVVMGAEFGEINDAILEVRAARTTLAGTWDERTARIVAAEAALLVEVAQVASLCVRWLDHAEVSHG